MKMRAQGTPGLLRCTLSDDLHLSEVSPITAR